MADVRESPAIDIIHLLASKGANVTYHDPHVAILETEGIVMDRVDDLDTGLRECDCAILVTDHSAYDFAEIAHVAPRLVDTRHVVPTE